MRRRSDSDELYFLTITTIGWADVFSRRIYRDYIVENFKTCQRIKGLNLFRYVIMSNHIHFIAAMDEGRRMDYFMRDFKSFTAKGLFDILTRDDSGYKKTWMLSLFTNAGGSNPNNKFIQVWQKGSYPVLLDNNFIIEQKAEYIEQNPVRAGIVQYPEHYIYSSASPISPIKCLDL